MPSGFEHPYSDGAIYYRKNTRDYIDSNTQVIGRSIAEVRKKNELLRKGGSPSVGGVATLKGRTFRFKSIKGSYVVTKKKRR